MKRIISIGLLVALGVGTAWADNKKLAVEEIGDGKDIWVCGSRHEAQVVFEVNDVFSLAFRSNLDSELDVEVDSVGTKKTYSIVLITQEPGVSYEARELTIMAPGFDDYRLSLSLKDREKHIYSVRDPYSELRSPFYRFMEEGNELFQKGEYQSARDKFNMARSCPEYANDSIGIKQHIADCDSLIEWGLKAEEHERYSEWQEALDTYRNMMRLNSSNEGIRQRYTTCLESFRSDCEAEFRNGEHYMAEGRPEDLKKAQECFKRVLDKKCGTQSEEATANLRSIKRQIDRENDHARCLIYDIDADRNMLLGLTYANCYNRQNKHCGGYITLRTNASAIRLVSKRGYAEGSWAGLDQSGFDTQGAQNAFAVAVSPTPVDGQVTFTPDADDYEQVTKGGKHSYAPKHLDYETSVTWGWTNQLYRWFYIHYGFGYHGGGFYTFSPTRFDKAAKLVAQGGEYSMTATDLSHEAQWTDKFRNAQCGHDWYSAPAVEAGLIVKVWRVVVKGTYQYNHWVGHNVDTYEDFFDDQRHRFYVGLGFNW